MFGVVYFKGADFNSEFLAYHPKESFLKSNDLSLLEEKNDVIWISNLDTLPDDVFSHLKLEKYFQITFGEIVYYFNINHHSLKNKIKKISTVFNDAILYFEDYLGETSLKTFKDCDFFFQAFYNVFAHKINVDDIILPFDNDSVVDEFNIHLSNEGNNQFYIHYNEIDSIEFLKKIPFTFSEWERVPSKDIGIEKAYSKAIEAFNEQYAIITEGNINNMRHDFKKALPSRVQKERAYFLDKEVQMYERHGKLDLNTFWVNENYKTGNQILKIWPKNKKTNIANRLVLRNYINKFLDEIKDNKALLYYVKELLKIQVLEKILYLKSESINVMAYNEQEILLSLKKEDVNSTLSMIEHFGLLYSSDLLEFLIE